MSLRIIQRQDSPKGFAKYEFRVKDTGIGISRSFQKHILEAFARMFRGYEYIQKYAKRLGVRIINETPGSFIDSFERSKK